MDMFSKTISSPLPKKHHRCVSLESGQTLTKKSYPKTPLDMPRFFPRRYSTPELVMRKHALKYLRDDNEQPISNKSCQTDILGLDKYLQRSPPENVSLNTTTSDSATVAMKAHKKLSKKPKVRSVAVHCERRRLSFSAFKGSQKFKHVYKRKISLPQPSSTTSTPPDDSRRDRNVLPKLQQPDKAETERPAACKTGQILKLPRILTTKDAEPDRTGECSGGSGIRLVKLQTRPQSTGSGGSDRKLAYFRVSSAPKIDSRYYTTVSTPQQVPERVQSTTTQGSSDTADTALDVSFGLQRQPYNSCTTTASTTTTTTTTRTVSTSTNFVEPVVFPIVFSCESVLRHPLEGGYVSHTESHRFSVHYVPVEDTMSTTTTAAPTTDTEDGTKSSLTFTSAGGCQNERCLTGDSISFTMCSKPEDSTVAQHTTPSTSMSEAISEQRLIAEHSNANVRFENVACDGNDDPQNNAIIANYHPIVGEPSSLDCCLTVNENRGHEKTTINSDKTIKNDNMIVQTAKYGLHVLGKGDVINRHINEFKKTLPSPMPAVNKIIDTFGGDGEDSTVFKSHAHTEDTMTLQFNERNYYERLIQDHQVLHPDRTVLTQSPKSDEHDNHDHHTTTQLNAAKYRNDLKLEENSYSYTNESDLTCTNTVKLTEKSINREPTKTSTNIIEADRLHDEPSQKQIENRHLIIDPPLESTQVHGQYCTGSMEKRQYEHGNKQHNRVYPNRLYDDMSRKRDNVKDKKGNPNHNDVRNATTIDGNKGRRVKNNDHDIKHTVQDSNTPRTINITINKTTPLDSTSNQYYGPFEKRLVNEMGCNNIDQLNIAESDTERYRTIASRQHLNSHARVKKENDTKVCHRCINSLSHKNDEFKNSASRNSNAKITDDIDDHDYKKTYDNNNMKNQYPMLKRPLESVDEAVESKESGCNNNYIGGFLFSDSFYKKMPQKQEVNNDRNKGQCSGYEYYDDANKMIFSSKSNGNDHCLYYKDYVPKTRHSHTIRDEDCTVFANVQSRNADIKDRNQPSPYSCMAGAETQTLYYSQLNDKKSYNDDHKNTDSDESLTDSLEECCKYEGGGAVSYFLALNGQQSAVTFTLKMPNTLQSRLNRRQSLLKKHLHVSTTAKKTSTRIRTRHKGCQTLWTVEKGVQVQRGSTANATRSAVDDHRVLETLLTGLNRNRVSENQIRVVGGLKMVSEGNQTEWPPELLTDRQTQTQKTKDVAAGPETPEKNVRNAAGGRHKPLQLPQAVKKMSTDNALMVGVVRQNKYKGKESLDGAKNDQLLTLSKGWINFYTLRDDSADTDAQGNEIELHDNDDGVKTEDDTQQYTVHVQAIPEPVTLPVVHVPNRTTLQLPKMTCSTAAKHLPKLLHTENNNHHCPSHLATANGWCVSVDGPNNMHMKVSLIPDKSDNKTVDNFDLNEENKLEAKRLALQRKNNCIRKPYSHRNIKRTQSTPRDMFSADVSRTESALSAESKYIETIDTQLLIHKARRRLSQEWDSRIQNRDVTESVQLVVTGDSVSSRTSHYATKGHQHCSFRRQSRRI